jgi:hypothetical protein
MLTLALALFLTLAGTSVAQAGWTTPPVTATASVAAGTLGVAQSGFDAASLAFTSGALSVTKPLTVTNTGSVSAPYSLAFGAQGSVTQLATDMVVRIWVVDNAGACTAAASATGTSAGTWSTLAPLAGKLAVGGSAVYCMRTSITAAQRFTRLADTVTATATLSASVGSWTSRPPVTVWTQTVANTLTPGTPTATATTDRSIALTWAPPADSFAVTGYRVYRDGSLITTTTTATPGYTDTGLTVGTSFAYTVVAVDAAADPSPASPGATLATAGVNPAAWYKVKVAGTQKCVDGENNSTVSGTAMITWDCKSTGFDNQAWRFPNPTGYSVVTGKYATTLAWDTSLNSGTDGKQAGAPAQLRSAVAGGVNQSWKINAVGNGTFRFSNTSGLCLDTAGVQTATKNTGLQQAVCGAAGLSSQTFTLTNVG